MKTFKIPVTWEVYGVVEIEAETLDEAIAIFDDTEDQVALPTDWDYVDASFRREDEETVSALNTI
jgi:hypothetical protein